MPALLAAVVLALTAACSAEVIPSDRWMGFNYPSWEHEELAAPASDASLVALAATGSNAVAIVPTHFADSCAASTVWADAVHTASPAAVEHAVERAVAAGLRVALKPHIDLVGWPCGRDQLAPTDLDLWFDSYITMLLEYAEIGERAGATMLIIATELDHLSTEEARWRDLIAEVRGHFSGTLTFATNPEAYELVQFWDALDYVGVDAYFPLARGLSAEADTIERGWTVGRNGRESLVEQLGNFALEVGRPLLFTEVGFRSVRGAAVLPASCEFPGAADEAAQADAYAATLAAFEDQSWWAGALWWAWVPDLGVGGCTAEFSPQGKIAEEVVTEQHPQFLGS